MTPVSTSRPLLTFVVPAYNEETNVENVVKRLLAVGEKLGHAFEVIPVNDGSTDSTGARLDELARSDQRVVPVHLSRNFGHMAALTAGLEAARGTGAVVCLDADGQHPPELIPRLVAAWEAGADIVQTVRLEATGSSFLKRGTSRLFYLVLNSLGGVTVPAGAADFRLMDRQVVDAINGLPEKSRFFRGLVYWVGFSKQTVAYEAPARLSGTTKYTFFKMVQFALSGITSFSNRPLRICFMFAVLVLAVLALYGAYVFYCLIAGRNFVSGWTSLFALILVLGAMQLSALAILSEYMARLYTETKARPVYIVRKPTCHKQDRDDNDHAR